MKTKWTRRLGRMALAGLLVIGLAACAGTIISSKRLCEGGGGKYTAGTCTPGKAMKAEEMCQFQAGTYNPSADTCQLPSDRTN